MLNNYAQGLTMMTPSSAAAEKLRKDIHSGHYKIGQRLANEHELASTFGVNRGTIRKALKILQEERLIARRQGHGTFVTNPTYAQPSGTAVSLLGAMSWDKEYYFCDILSEAFLRSISRGYMLTTTLNATNDIESRNAEALMKSGIRGLIISPKPHSIGTYRRFTEAGIPVVMLDSTLPNVDEDFVSVNDRMGSYMATRHLVELGHASIGYVGNENFKNDFPCGPDRLEGFNLACAQHNIEVPQNWYVQSDVMVESDYLPKLRSLLGQSNHPTAIVAFSDIWAIQVIRVARELGLKVPQDLSITGFDDSEVSRTNSIPLTTVSPEPDEIGKTIIDLLVEKIENPQPRPKRSILITPRLVVRESTAKPS
ncbi:MAG: GntR family transcriptional regulator [Sedimentisphaerales bacterium]